MGFLYPDAGLREFRQDPFLQGQIQRQGQGTLPKEKGCVRMRRLAGGILFHKNRSFGSVEGMRRRIVPSGYARQPKILI